jgi:uncharacterized membrane protein YfcA
LQRCELVTGSTSLITVPLMIGLGTESHVTISTNMLALTLMSAGGSAPFAGKGVIRRDYLPVSLMLTAVGSALGALLLLRIEARPLQITIGVAMVVAASFTLAYHRLGTVGEGVEASRSSRVAAYALVFVLAIYGGFFSGGYATMLTAVFVVLSRMSFLQAIATTKVINAVSSGVATLVFLARGTVDVRLGLVLGVAMFVGGLVGARWALTWDAKWLRWVFVASVLALAVVVLVRAV